MEHPTGGRDQRSVETDDRPEVPEGVLRGIEDLEEGNTASKEELESVLNF